MQCWSFSAWQTLSPLQNECFFQQAQPGSMGEGQYQQGQSWLRAKNNVAKTLEIFLLILEI